MLQDRQLRDELHQARLVARTAVRDVAAMATIVERLARVTITSGQAPIPTMLLGTTTRITVTLRTPMPDDTYSATATVTSATAPNILGSVQVDGISAQTADTVTVQVRATGVVSLGAIVTVHAVRHS